MVVKDTGHTEEELKEWIKKKENREEVIGKVCRGCESTGTRIAIFMAGSPGAGKTETARGLLEEIPEGNSSSERSSKSLPFVHIDQDAVKAMLPGYSGELSEKYHGAASIGVEKVFDHIIKKKLNFILDSTFSNIEKARDNVGRVLKKEYIVDVFFVYQEPRHAWDFIKERERKEGRKVPRKAFINQFLDARVVVNDIKKQFGGKVKLHFVLKTVNEKDGVVKEEYKFNVQNVDGYVGKVYTEEELYDLVSE